MRKFQAYNHNNDVVIVQVQVNETPQSNKETRREKQTQELSDSYNVEEIR